MPSCKHDLIYNTPINIPVDTSHKPPPVDTTHCDTCAAGVISFSEDVLPILVSNCATTGCHDSISHREGLVTTSYQWLMSTSNISSRLLNSGFWRSINGSSGEDQMPPGNPLTAAQLSIIQQWLQQGAPNTTCRHQCGCDSTNMSFATNIYPIIQTYCTGCHKPGAASGSVDLTGYSNLLAQVNNGKLMKTIKHETAPGIVAMPYGSQKLSDCTISKIQSWVNAGAPNN